MSYAKKLFGLEKKGTYKVWSIEVYDNLVSGCDDQATAWISITHGKEGGKLTEQIETITIGKQGRTVTEQAVLQAEARVKKQLDKNYRFTKEELNDLPVLAMLAQDASGELEKRIPKDVVENGVITSDKFDGNRCLAKCSAPGVVELFSRTNQLLNIPHIAAELAMVMQPGQILDGEIYLHGYVLEDIQSAVGRTDTQKEIDKAQKKHDKVNAREPDMSVSDDTWFRDYEKTLYELKQAQLIHVIRPLLEFHVFDFVVPDTRFDDRLGLLTAWFTNVYLADPDYGKFVKQVRYNIAYSYEELYTQHSDAVDRGYEGLMIRIPEFFYESGKRSNGIWKLKAFIDAEFLIIDVLADKNDGAIYWMQNNKDNIFGDREEFGCIMGTEIEKAYALENKGEFIGKWITVQYQSRFKKSMLPQFPTGKMIREVDYDGNPVM